MFAFVSHFQLGCLNLKLNPNSMIVGNNTVLNINVTRLYFLVLVNLMTLPVGVFNINIITLFTMLLIFLSPANITADN